MSKRKAPVPPPPPPEDADDGTSPTQIVRISNDHHFKLKIISAMEKKSLRQVIDELLDGQIDAYFKEKKISLGSRS